MIFDAQQQGRTDARTPQASTTPGSGEAGTLAGPAGSEFTARTSAAQRYAAAPAAYWAAYPATRQSWLSKHWPGLTNSVVGTFATLPWLAPIFAKLTWWPAADFIYSFYMFFCHQLPERAGSLFGYQVAYCFRNSAIYTSIFLAGLLFAAARRWGGRLAWLLKPLPWQLFLLAMLPIGIDGLTHMLGLRQDKAWFDNLTGGAFGDFSVGDSLGTLNWWLRVTSGALFGGSVVWLVCPWIERAVNPIRDWYQPLLQQPAEAVGSAEPETP